MKMCKRYCIVYSIIFDRVTVLSDLEICQLLLYTPFDFLKTSQVFLLFKQRYAYEFSFLVRSFLVELLPNWTEFNIVSIRGGNL